MSVPFRMVSVLAVALGSPALAAGPLSVVSEVRVEQRAAAADGTTRVVLATPRHVVPGDRLIFTLRYRNTGVQPLGAVVLANPVPAGIAFRAILPGTPAPEMSLDGQHFAALGDLRVTAPGGAGRPAQSGDVVALRWRLAQPLAPGAGGTLTFAGEVK